MAEELKMLFFEAPRNHAKPRREDGLFLRFAAGKLLQV